jgi:hypothetical protein
MLAQVETRTRPIAITGISDIHEFKLGALTQTNSFAAIDIPDDAVEIRRVAPFTTEALISPGYRRLRPGAVVHGLATDTWLQRAPWADLAIEMEGIGMAQTQNAPEPTLTTVEAELVSKRAVMRNGSVLAAATAFVLGVGTALSGVTLLHPLLSTIVLIGSASVYAMSFLDP